jgi:transposase
MSKRRTHSPEFKARVAMEAISGRKTIQEIAADHAIHPIQVSQWKRQLLDGASDLFTRGKKSKDKEEGQAKEAELFQQIGRLQMELEWLKKKVSAALMPVTCASWSITTTPSSASAANVLCWACPDPRSITGPHRYRHRPCGSWRGSTLSTWRIPAAAAVEWWTTWPERGSRSAVTEVGAFYWTVLVRVG